MTATLPPSGGALAETYAAWLSGLDIAALPQSFRRVVSLDLIDATGLCIAARGEPYMAQIVHGWDSDGPCTALGHARRLDAAGAAAANGMAIHGEDFDDTLEGAPIRVGAMTIPAALAAAERFGLSGERAFLGVAAGLETVCRLNHIAPGAIHRAGFHPVGVIGALGAAAAAGVTLGLDARQQASAFGLAGSMASGILEYLSEGAWTKRLHPGWAAQSGLRAAVLARTGFFAPRTVLDGPHGFFHAFAPTATPDFRHLAEGLGQDWYAERIAFKPYACGTMIHPYVDCMIRLAATGIRADQIRSITCPTGEGLVHRLWEPLAGKHRPPSGYAAKFSMPYCMAVGFFDGDAGLSQFTDARAADPEVLALAEKISYVIDPENEYPRNYSGHIRVETTDGRRIALDQPHMRGGVRDPLTEDEIRAKALANCRHGGWPDDRAERLTDWAADLARHPDLSGLAAFAT
ncbi:MmgE/PrpD family protein [Aliigemmobacter aestuarii]|uniref:MmgE/PrpD family protein n=1 Tax=Aliigemmobacter aestuarii TaxID=1445661 RepID=A0A4S3ML06_9RHOB|nr:MmgE/PrpD family protein [Gemmobacter aestuarii]THD82757.1 MmgE/PrpD family protein [Gemmobacter aestuarii]